MKNRCLVALVMLFALAEFSAYAGMTTSVRVTVPFEFSIHNRVMPAGEYLIADTGATGGSALAISDAHGAHTTFFVGAPARQGGSLYESSVVFHRYGSSYFLAGIWWGDGHIAGVEVPQSKSEKELAQTAGLRQPYRIVLVASR